MSVGVEGRGLVMCGTIEKCLKGKGVDHIDTIGPFNLNR